MVKLNSESLLRQCQECGQVYLAGEPAADRIPRTCPNECGAAVLDASSLLSTIRGGVELCR